MCSIESFCHHHSRSANKLSTEDTKHTSIFVAAVQVLDGSSFRFDNDPVTKCITKTPFCTRATDAIMTCLFDSSEEMQVNQSFWINSFDSSYVCGSIAVFNNLLKPVSCIFFFFFFRWYFDIITMPVLTNQKVWLPSSSYDPKNKFFCSLLQAFFSKSTIRWWKKSYKWKPWPLTTTLSPLCNLTHLKESFKRMIPLWIDSLSTIWTGLFTGLAANGWM